MKIQKDIYVDVDGTLTREPLINDGKGDGIRDDVEEFIIFLVENFENVYWFTYNTLFAKYVVRELVGEKVSSKIKFKMYENTKYEMIDYTRPFYIFDDELNFGVWQKIGLLYDSIPECEKEPFKSKYSPSMHTLYYIASDDPMDKLKYVIDDVKRMENIE